MYNKLEDVYRQMGLKYVIDSAFSSMKYELLIKSSQDDLTAGDEFTTIDEQIADIAMRREATSMRQCAEWGMRAVQLSFPRLKDTMTYEEHGERRIIFDCLFLLFNLHHLCIYQT
jgi:hypothetical protein